MQSVTMIGVPILGILMALLYILSMGQTFHAVYLMVCKGTRHLALVASYELLLVLHLVLDVAIVRSAMVNTGFYELRLWVVHVPLDVLLWVNVATALLAGVLCIMMRQPARLPEIVVLMACTPYAMAVMGTRWWLVLVLDASFFLFRVSTELVLDVYHHRRSVTHFSVVEAVRRLPEGIVYADRHGRVVLMNDAMRACLSALGLSTDLADARGLWDALQEMAARSDDPDSRLPEGLCLSISDDETRLFVADEVQLHGKPCERIMAVDITEEERLNARIAYTNRMLEIASGELQRSMDDVNAVARHEALLNMQSRVHDIIGQRLSILHRYLEDGAESEESLAQISSLLGSIMDDLAVGEHVSQAEDLAAIVNAFALVDLSLDVHGTLPRSESVSNAFVRIIREAATNAVRHGQAKNLDVVILEDARQVTMVIVNDGLSSTGTIHEGLGLPGMRQAASEIGGDLSIPTSSPFTVQVVVPKEGDGK